jgi:hypothetical protein
MDQVMEGVVQQCSDSGFVLFNSQAFLLCSLKVWLQMQTLMPQPSAFLHAAQHMARMRWEALPSIRPQRDNTIDPTLFIL